jgi:hypothetical protein
LDAVVIVMCVLDFVFLKDHRLETCVPVVVDTRLAMIDEPHAHPQDLFYVDVRTPIAHNDGCASSRMVNRMVNTMLRGLVLHGIIVIIVVVISDYIRWHCIGQHHVSVFGWNVSTALHYVRNPFDPCMLVGVPMLAMMSS